MIKTSFDFSCYLAANVNECADDFAVYGAILSDGDGELVHELRLVEDMGFGVGVRSKRFALVLEDGKVSHLQVDDGMDDIIPEASEHAGNAISVLDKITSVENNEKEYL